MFLSPSNIENNVLCLMLSQKEIFVLDYAVDDATTTTG
jgi:hypothetical protein